MCKGVYSYGGLITEGVAAVVVVNEAWWVNVMVDGMSASIVVIIIGRRGSRSDGC